MKKIIIILFVIFLANSLCQSQEIFLAIKKNKKWGVINTEGKKIIEPKYDFIGNFSQANTALALRNERMGLLNSEGKEVIAFDNIYASFLNESLAVFLRKKYRLLDVTGKEILPEEYDSIFVTKIHYQYQREIELVKAVKDSSFLLLDITGKRFTKNPMDSLILLKNGFIKTFLKNKQGIIDSVGNTILETQFTDIKFKNTQIEAYIDQKKGLYTLQGAEIFPPQFEQIQRIPQTDFYWGKSDKKIGVFDQNGQEVMPLEYDNIDIVNTHYLILGKNKLKGMYFLLAKQWTFKLEYDNIIPYNPTGGQAIFFTLSKQQQKTIVDIAGNKFLNGINYDRIMYDDVSKLFYVYKDKKVGFSGRLGSVTPSFDYISRFNKNLALVKNKDKNGDEKKGIVNIYGEVLIPPAYKNIKVKGNSIRCPRDDGKTDVLELDNNRRALGKIKKGLKIREIRVSGRQYKEKEEVLEFDDSTDELQEFNNRPRRSRGRGRIMNTNFGRPIITTPVGVAIPVGKYRLEVFKQVIAEEKKDERGNVKRIDSVDAYGIRNVTLNKLLVPPRTNNNIDIMMQDFRLGNITPSGLSYVNIEGKGLTMAEYIDRSGKVKKARIMKSQAFDRYGLSIFNVKGFYRKKDDLRGGYWGIMNRQGQVVNTAQYEEIAGDLVKKKIQYSYRGGRRTQTYWKLGKIDTTGKEIIPVQFYRIEPLEQSDEKYLLVTERKKRYGILDEAKDDIVVNVDYLDIQALSEKMVAVKVSEKYDSAWSFVNLDNKLVHEPAFSKVRDFSSGYGAIRQGNFWGFIDNQGSMLVKPSFARVGDFHEDLAYFYKSAKYGYINPQLDTVIQAIYRSAGDFHHGRAVVKGEKKNDGFGVIDKNGNWIIGPNYAKIENFDKYGLAVFKKNSKDKEYGLMNAQGDIIFSNRYKKIWSFQEGVALVKTTKSKYNFIDSLGNVLHEKDFDYVRNSVTRVFNEGITAFRSGKLWGFLNSKGEIMIEATYKDVANFNLGICRVKSVQNKEFYINTSGEKIEYEAVRKVFEKQEIDKKLALSTNNIQYFKIPKKKNGNYTAIMVGEFKGVTDLQGKFILEPIYQNIQYVGEDIFRLEKDGGIGYWHLNKGWIWQFTK